MGSPVNNSRTVMVGDNLNSAVETTSIEELIQDASPQLGADLDCNGYDIQFDDGTGVEDDAGNKTLLFGKTVAATTYAKITNNATGITGPLLEAAGETNVDLRLAAAGTGDIKVTTGGLRVTSDNEALSVGAGNDLAISHDGSNSTITGGVGKITVTPAAGSVLELDNSNATVDNGSVQITGDLDVDNISIDGNTVSSTSGDLQLKAVSGSSITFQDDADATKQLTLDFATIGSGAERTWTFPNSNGTLVGKDTTDTLTNKTLTAPVLNDPTFDVAVGVTAHTGSAQGNGAITSTFVEIATVGTTGDAVTLPAAAAGKIVIIANNGANSADVFPASGDKIDGGSANAALALAAGANRIHICQDGTDWDTIQGSGAGGLSNLSEDSSPQLGGDLDCNGAQIQWSKGSDVASATALPLLTDGNYFDVTGTATVTSFDATGGPGTQIKLHFNAACTLTHNSDLILPGGANIVTAAGDEADFIEFSAGDYRCTSYTKATGGPVLIPDNSIDSDAYVDASIDAAHLAVGKGGALSLNGAPADHVAHGPQTATFNAGYTTVQSDLVYLDSNSKWLEADADATGVKSTSLLGIALEVKDDGEALNVALPGSFIHDANVFSFTPGLPLYMHTTDGAITATKPTGSGDTVRTVGYAVHANMIFFNPSSDYVTLA